MNILFLVIFGTALVAPYLHKLFRSWTGWVLSLIPAGAFAYMFTFAEPVLVHGKSKTVAYEWLPSITQGIAFSFYVDGLSLLFSFLILGIGTLIVIYGGGYLKGDRDAGRFFLSLFLFMGSMLGVVLADNIILLFVFWEGTSFTSFLLIGYYHEDHTSRRNALQALLVTGIGGLAMFAGLIMMGIIGGDFALSALLQEGETIRRHALYLPVLLLVIFGAVTKSAQFPFHFWLPNAMVAPTPVSAYLHSATMVKAGIYLLARLLPILGGTFAWTGVVTTFGAVTMVVTAWLALCYTDLKQVLAYSTLMILGLIVMLIGLGTDYAIKAAVVMILAHALYKGTLFMVAGSVDHETGTRDVTELNGLIKSMPATGTCALVAALSMAGVIPLIGFIGKELVFKAALKLNDPLFSKVIVGCGVVGSIGVIASAAVVSLYPFLGEEEQAPEHPHEAPVSMWIGPVILAGLSVLFGVWSSLIDHSLVAGAVSSILHSTHHKEVHLALWHGVNTPLMLSGVTLFFGGLTYVFWDSLREGTVFGGIRTAFGWAPDRGYDYAVKGLKGTAYWQTRVLQSGTLRYYMMFVFSTVILLVAGTAWLNQNLIFRQLSADMLDGSVRFYEGFVILLMIGGAYAAVWARTKLSAVISLGIAGFSVALLYMMFSAPDVAITQLLVETLTVVLIAFVMLYLPETPTEVGFTWAKARDAVIAIGSGASLTLLILVALSMNFDPSLSEYFAKHSYSSAHGRNIVNVILVDFRAFDTLGEITVLGTAAAGVYALLKLRPEDDEETDESGEPEESAS